MGKSGFSAAKLAALGILTALSLGVFMLESLLPQTLIPGARPGLSNVFSLLALIMYSPVEAVIVVAVRTLLGAVFAGNVSALMYSFTGGIVAIIVSSLFIYLVYPKVSLISVSVASAVAHNLTQNAVYALIARTPLMFAYAPYLVLAGVISGTIVGALITLLIKGVPQSAFEKLICEKRAAAHNTGADGSTAILNAHAAEGDMPKSSGEVTTAADGSAEEKTADDSTGKTADKDG